MILQSFRHFLVFSKIQRKRKHSRGHVACSPSGRGDLPVWALGTRGALGKYPGGSLGSGTRDTWHARAASGGTLPAWVLGTRGKLGRRGALGGFRGWLSVGGSGTRGTLQKFLKEVPVEASKGAFGRASGWLRKGLSVRLWEHVSYSERL